MAHKFGKLPARPGSIQLQLSDYIAPRVLPTPPDSFGHDGLVQNWGMLANDKVGNCLAGHTIVSAPDIVGALKMPYEGPLVTLVMSSGKTLTVTPKHSILTVDGFAAADTIKEGDYLVGASGTKVLPGAVSHAGNAHLNQGPSPVNEIFSSLRVGRCSARKIVPSAVDFHGDQQFFNGDVDIVWADGFLRDEVNSALDEPHTKDKVSATGELKRVLISAGAALHSFWRSLLAPHGDVGLGSYRPALAYAHSGVSKPELLGLGSERVSGFDDSLLKKTSGNIGELSGVFHRRASDVHLDGFADVAVSALRSEPANLCVCPDRPVASLNHPSAKRRTTDPHFFRDLLDAFPGLVEADRVVSVHVQRNVRTHVYDLATSCRWYLADGIVTHNCVIAGGAHEHMLWNAMSGRPAVTFSDWSVTRDYSAITGYSRWKPWSDNGTDMQEAARYRQRTGLLDYKLRRHRIGAYVLIKAGDVHQHRLATYLFGAIGVGVRCPEAMDKQFDQHKPFDYVAGSKIVGGHYMPAVAVRDGMLQMVTWGRVHPMTAQFLEAYNDESVAYVSLEMLKGDQTVDGFDYQRLLSDLHQLQAK